MPITFENIEAWDGEHQVVTFPAQVNGTRVRCAISREALEDHLGANNIEPLNAFRTNRQRIEAKAEQLIGRGRFERDGSILIRTADWDLR
jgi:hypothetical protein